MRKRVIVSSAQSQVDAIAEFIASGHLQRGEEYFDTALDLVFTIPEDRLPARASEHLPGDVRRVFVPGFRGYTLRLLYREDHIALVAAFRPGLTEAMRDEATRPGLDEFSEGYE